MTILLDRTSISERLKDLIREITRNQEMELNSQKSLMMDYGLDSLDLLDFSFCIEESFGVKIGANELRGKAKEKMKEEDFLDYHGNISQKALDELKKSIPEIPTEHFTYGLRQEDIPKLLNIDVFVRIIFEKLQEQKS